MNDTSGKLVKQKQTNKQQQQQQQQKSVKKLCGTRIEILGEAQDDSLPKETGSNS